MKPLSRESLHGTWATVFLPVNSRGQLDWSNLGTQLEALRTAGVAGIYCNGTAGEFFNQSEAEYRELAKQLSGYCEEHRIPFQLGASHCHPKGTLDRIATAKEYQPGAIQVILPEWISLQWEEICDYVVGLVEAAHPVPLVVYNPPNARVALSPGQWEALTRLTDGIIGIKVLGGDSTWHRDMAETGRRISVFVGGSRLATGRIHGCARGSYSNVACYAPAGARAWSERMLDYPEQALKEENQIQEAFQVALHPYLGKVSHAAIDKALACAGGWGPRSPKLRWPLASIPESGVVRMAGILRERLPFLEAYSNHDGDGLH